MSNRVSGYGGLGDRVERTRAAEERRDGPHQAEGRHVFVSEGARGWVPGLLVAWGTPFGQLRRNGGTWLSEGQRLDQVLLCSIVDVTHLVTTASLALGDHAAAQKAAQLAVRVAPAEETAQLDLAAALASQGHHRAAEQLLRENVFDRSDDEDEAPTEIPARTEQIIDNNPKWLARRSTRASA